MTVVAANIGSTYDHKAGKRDRIHLLGLFTITGSSGAVGTSDVDDEAMTAERTAAGNYDLTFPKAPRGVVKVTLQVGTTVFTNRVETCDVTDGVAHVAFGIADGTDTELAAADVFAVEVELDTGK
jgi:hypothetical protein